MTTYFVTGAMGFIGSHWCEHLLNQGHRVIGLDIGRFHTRLLDFEHFIFVHDTIRNSHIVETCVDASDVVCHFCGIAKPQTYVRSPLKVLDITARCSMDLINMCRLKEKLFFFTSTSEVYGKSKDIPFTEDGDRLLGSTSTHRWCYATAKALVEHYLHACASSNELRHVVVRLFNVYGPRLTGRVASRFLKNALRGEPLVVHGDGMQTRSFTYADDVMDAFDRLIATESCHNKVFNVGNPTETTIKEFAQEVLRLTGSPSELIFKNHKECYGDSYEDVPRRVPDITKLRTHTGWEPTTPLDEGLRRTISYMKNEQ